VSLLRVGMLLLLLGCGGPAETVAPTSFVSLSPGITETLGALGAVDRLVGRSDWCLLPAEAQALPAMGSALTPRFEALAAAQPVTVLVDGSAGTRLEELRALGAVEVLPWLSREEVIGSVRRLGVLTGREASAEALAARFEAALSDAPPAGEVARVLVVLGGMGLDAGEVWFVRRDSLHGAMLHGAGARNAVDRDIGGAPRLSLEAVLALDPDAVVVLVQAVLDEAARAQIVADWERLAPMAAVRAGRVRVIDGPATLSPGPTVLALTRQLRETLQAMDLPLAGCCALGPSHVRSPVSGREGRREHAEACDRRTDEDQESAGVRGDGTMCDRLPTPGR
jgi:ABC-type hemin transport system substrate-binding protein